MDSQPNKKYKILNLIIKYKKCICHMMMKSFKTPDWQKASYYKTKKPTLQNQITALKAQVSKNKAETQYFRSAGDHVSGAAGVETTHYLITDSIVNSSGFRDNITGDKWVNKFLKLRFVGNDDCNLLRILIYFPKKAGTSFSPSSHKRTAIPDPSSFWVVMDRTITEKDASGKFSTEAFLNLLGKHTLYDSNASSIERGELIMTVISEGAPSSTLYSWGYELGYCNK